MLDRGVEDRTGIAGSPRSLPPAAILPGDPDDDTGSWRELAPRGRSAIVASWLFGLAALGVVIGFALHLREEEEILVRIEEVRPWWLLVGIALQAGTYLSEARILQQVLARAGTRRPLRQLVGVAMARLFVDQAVPTGGASGTIFVLRAFARRGIERGATMAAVVVSLLTHYVAYGLALGAGVAIVGLRGRLTPAIVVPALLYSVLAVGAPVLLLMMDRRAKGAEPRWVARIPFFSRVFEALSETPPGLAREPRLIARCTFWQLVIVLLDATTLWAMLYAAGTRAAPSAVFAGFMLASLARSVGFVPGGVGTFEAVAVASLHVMGIPLAPALTATLLFRAFSFWFPMIPGLLIARRELRRGKDEGGGTA